MNLIPKIRTSGIRTSGDRTSGRPPVAQQPIRWQLKTITIQSRTLGFQDLYFLN